MKKLAVLFTLVFLTVAMATTVFANTGNGPHTRPFGDNISFDSSIGAIRVEIARENTPGQQQFLGIFVNGRHLMDFPVENGTFVAGVPIGNYVLLVGVQGNSLHSLELVPPSGPYVPTLVSRGVETVSTEVSRELVDVDFRAHIVQSPGRDNVVQFAAVGRILVTTTVTTRAVYRWSDGSVTFGELQAESSTRTESADFSRNYANQNNFFNVPRQIAVGPFTVRFQPIGNTDVRVFEFVSVTSSFTVNGNEVTVSNRFDGNICQLSQPPVTWEMTQNGRRGQSVWNRQGR